MGIRGTGNIDGARTLNERVSMLSHPTVRCAIQPKAFFLSQNQESR